MVLIVVLSTVSPPQVVKAGDTVTVNYTLMLEDGTIYYSTYRSEPLHITLGQGLIIQGFEDALFGMRVGESRSFTLSPEEAYGPYRPDLVGTVDRSQLSEGIEPFIGKQVQTEFLDGTPVIAVITSFDEATLTLDANHPLAGQVLTFNVELLEIGNSTTPARPFPAMLVWMTLALGIAASGIRYFNIRNRGRLTTHRRIAASRR